MTRMPMSGRNLARLVVAGAFAVSAPLAMTGTAAAHSTSESGSASSSTWDKLAQCESSGNWSANTGNGYSGGLQFAPSTWRAFGGEGKAHNASRSEQITVAKKVLAAQGWDAWPSCSEKLGLS